MENSTVQVMYGPTGRQAPRNYHFDKVFGMYSRQDEVFDQMIQPVVQEAMAGFCCTVFAYGPTGTGKTYTIEGDINDDDLCGLIPRTSNYIFDTLNSMGLDYSVKVSFLEICKWRSCRAFLPLLLFYVARLLIPMQSRD